MSGRPGQEFYARKLKRAREVPEAERCPVVAAFVASEDLLAAVRELLPVQGSEPALPPTAANQRQVARAYALAARACYLCPCPPVSQPDGLHIYVGFLPELNELLQHPGSGAGASASWSSVSRSSGAGGGTSSSAGSSDFDITAAILDNFIAMTLLGRLGGVELVTAAAGGLRLLQLLGRPALMAAVDRQLALFEAPRLPAQQLRYAIAHETGRNALFLLSACRVMERFHREQTQLPRTLLQPETADLRLSSQQKARLSGALSAATAVLLQLEPDNPKTYTVAAAAQEMLQRRQQSCDLYLRGIQLARQQRSDYYCTWRFLRCTSCSRSRRAHGKQASAAHQLKQQWRPSQRWHQHCAVASVCCPSGGQPSWVPFSPAASRHTQQCSSSCCMAGKLI